MTLRRTRISSIPDMVRMSAAFSRPGIDPRIWCSLAYAKDESKIDPKYGDLVDVVLLPSEQEVTCRVPQSYAGKDFGASEGRIHKDDEIVVLFPDGDPGQGGFVIARVWGAADTPPKLAADNEKDIVRVFEKDINLRIQFQGDAVHNVQWGDDTLFKMKKDGLELGKEPDDYMALAKLVKGEIQALRDTVNSLVSTYNGHTHVVTGIVTAGSPVTQTQTVPVPTQTTAAAATAPAAVNDVKSAFVKSK